MLRADGYERVADLANFQMPFFSPQRSKNHIFFLPNFLNGRIRSVRAKEHFLTVSVPLCKVTTYILITVKTQQALRQ
jgi:hypothetical protein